MTANTAAQTALSFHPSWEVSKQEFYVYQYHLLQLDPLEESQLSIAGVKLEAYEEFFSITSLIRSTVSKPIQFEMLQLLLLDENQEVVARETFDMERFGELPPNTARPWRFIFGVDTLLEGKDIPSGNWTIAFELKKKNEHVLDLDPSWKEGLTPEQTKRLEQMVQNMPPMGANELNMMGLEASLNPAGDLKISLLIRNGSLNNIKLEQVPLTVEDAAGDIVAAGVFKTESLEVKGNTSKPWSFVFPKEMVKKENPDFTSWRVYPPQG
ncbi:accessory Sec system S-layer assembly protein [Bacillus sp. FJAT-42376]|uniref:accessory Sec system S-layer assembly protein n=1 Tax=Bacillus sp. FJAT-42376 TaxID=2014076 RepID=UPI000F4DDCB7|nr:accessory Sec system S-layer assembly protein [Bacillus sp. FJAT-42376]AZB44564.1 accessory Sec system S-layer assembly protein [Bacillus sp. FJAT-42376]